MPQRDQSPCVAPIQLEALRMQAIEYLIGRINYERLPSPPYAERFLKLDRMRSLLLRLGNPDAGMPIVHIAGTKGKGSTSAMLGGILRAAGMNVGIFSSPHLDRLEERFSVNALPCPADQLVALVAQVQPIVAQMDAEAEGNGDAQLTPTFFEIITAMALLHFSQQRVDVAILEVGLGGRLDSTNVCQPAVSVITSISYDHTAQLGTTLGEIAAEKAGIIKPGAPVVVGRLPHEAREVVAQIARKRGARVIEAGRDFNYNYRPPRSGEATLERGALDFATQDPTATQLENVTLRMAGARQADNAAAALATAMELRRQNWSISHRAMRQGLANAALPGRMEVLGRHPTVVLDVAHNVAAAEALVECLQTCFSARRHVLLFAGTRDKDLQGMARVLAPHFDQVVLTQYQQNSRAASVDRVAAIWRSQCNLPTSQPAGALRPQEPLVCYDPYEAWLHARGFAGEEDLVCVTGSFFIAAELRRPMMLDCAEAEQQAESTETGSTTGN